MKSDKPYGRYFERPVSQRTKAELFGLVQGVLADGYVVEEEARTLCKWIERNHATREQWPANVLYDRITTMLSDGVLDAAEQRELIGILLKYMERVEAFGTASPPEAVPLAPHITLDNPFDRPSPAVKHKNCIFVVTGEFAIGTRPFVIGLIEARGGQVQESVTKSVNFVVVGEFGSDAWVAKKKWGTKIEKAVAFRQKGTPIFVIEEKHWASSLHPETGP
ncbi:MAG: BRCT domain-containing protein [Achromobacter sp.]|nr:BRCT domain-containing protein [Achromobacter sp.]